MVRISKINETSCFVSIGGFKGVFIRDVDDFLDKIKETVSSTQFQVFDASRIGGYRHIFHASVNAVMAFERGYAISKSLSIEVLLYASCQDQISQALTILGLKPETKEIGLVIFEKSLEDAREAYRRVVPFLGEADDSVLDLDEKKFHELKKIFGVSEKSLDVVGGAKKDALTKLLIEKGALLPLRR